MIILHRQRWFRRELRTRIPFRYGIAVMKRVPHVWLEIEATIDGQRVIGRSADHLPPKWFTKDPQRDVADEIAAMHTVLHQAGKHAEGLEAPTLFAFMHEVDRRQAEWATAHVMPPLLANFGATFIERALLDAYCRRYDTTIGEALRGDGLGIDLSQIHAELNGVRPSSFLPAQTLDTVTCRHTVGLGDPLEDDEATEAEDAPDDGLPVSLREVVQCYGIRHFKVKVSGDATASLNRLERIMAIVAENSGPDYRVSLDGNETYATIAAFRAFWDEAQSRPGLNELWPRLLFVEQPLARAAALGDDVGDAMRSWSDRPMLLIDESGGAPADARRALDLGYDGMSHKNCKGVFHGLANRGLLAAREKAGAIRPLMMSAEDLSNVGPIALPQDLAVQAALGNVSVERNGHHYFAGLSGWPESVQTQALLNYPELYIPHASGWPAVNVVAGTIDLHAVNRNAFGGAADPGLTGAGECWADLG